MPRVAYDQISIKFDPSDGIVTVAITVGDQTDYIRTPLTEAEAALLAARLLNYAGSWP